MHCITLSADDKKIISFVSLGLKTTEKAILGSQYKNMKTKLPNSYRLLTDNPNLCRGLKSGSFENTIVKYFTCNKGKIKM